MFLDNDCLNSQHLNWFLVWIFYLCHSHSLPLLCMSFPCLLSLCSGTAGTAFFWGGAAMTVLTAGLWQSQQGFSFLQALAPTWRDARRPSMRGGSLQASHRGLGLRIAMAGSQLPTSPGVQRWGSPQLRRVWGASSPLETVRGKTWFSQSQVSRL